MISSLRLAALTAAVAFTGAAAAQEVTGAGATFPAPLYAKWASDYNKATGVKINYQSVGSGAGIRQIDAKTVTFGASDMPLKDEELAKDGLVEPDHLPEAMRQAASEEAAPLAEDEAALRGELEASLRAHGGNVTAVARAFGKTRTQIHRWMRRYGLKGGK